MYMPFGDPLGDQLGALTDGLGQLTDLEISSAGDSLIYDYQGPEYGDTRVIMAAMKNLTEQSFDELADFIDALVTTPLFAQLPDPVPFPNIPAPDAPTLPSSTVSGDGIDLSALLGSGGVLADYPGLKFRSVPAYLYIDGPARLFQNGNISIDLQFTDAAGTALMPPEHITVSPVAFPELPEVSGAVVSALSPPSPVLIELKDIFNADPQPEGLKADISFTIGEIGIPKNELAAFAADLRTPLRAHLALLLPFQFTTSSPIPIFAGPDLGDPPPAGSPPNPAMELIPDGGDLLGRGGGDDEEGTMKDIIESLKSLSVEALVTNNLGINGYVRMLSGMPAAAPSPEPRELGKINLSGASTLTIAKSDLETPPFSPALEIFLDGDFDIRRSLPPEGAMTMNMAIILRTDIDMTF